MQGGEATAGNGRVTDVISLRPLSRTSTGFLPAAWIVSIALLPVYVGGSGGIQPGHVVMAFAALWTLATLGVRIDGFCLTICLLNGVVVVRSLWEVVRTGDTSMFMPAGYFLFNSIVTLALRAFIERDIDLHAVRRGMAMALMVAICGLAILGVRGGVDGAERMAGTFNNPNQLGYFSACACSLMALLYFRGCVGLRGLAVAIVVGGVLTAMSLSKAALVANALGIAFGSLGIRRSSKWLLLGIVTLTIFPICGMSLIESGALDDIAVVRRIRQIGQDSDDTLEARGYGLLLSDDPGVILFGRSPEDILNVLGHEVHSSIGSIWVGYGAVGGLLFVALLAMWCGRLTIRHGMLAALAVMLPPLLYGLTHNGTRATIFWVLLAVSQANAPKGRNSTRRAIA